MVGRLYKINSEVVARRLRYITKKVISNAQTKFFEYRNIADRLITVNSAIL